LQFWSAQPAALASQALPSQPGQPIQSPKEADGARPSTAASQAQLASQAKPFTPASQPASHAELHIHASQPVNQESKNSNWKKVDNTKI